MMGETVETLNGGPCMRLHPLARTHGPSTLDPHSAFCTTSISSCQHPTLALHKMFFASTPDHVQNAEESGVTFDTGETGLFSAAG